MPLGGQFCSSVSHHRPHIKPGWQPGWSGERHLESEGKQQLQKGPRIPTLARPYAPNTRKAKFIVLYEPLGTRKQV